MTPEPATTHVFGTAQYSYCPLCGRKTRTETFEVGAHKTNQRTVCPHHGELIHR